MSGTTLGPAIGHQTQRLLDADASEDVVLSSPRPAAATARRLQRSSSRFYSALVSPLVLTTVVSHQRVRGRRLTGLSTRASTSSTRRASLVVTTTQRAHQFNDGLVLSPPTTTIVRHGTTHFRPWPSPTRPGDAFTPVLFTVHPQPLHVIPSSPPHHTNASKHRSPFFPPLVPLRPPFGACRTALVVSIPLSAHLSARPHHRHVIVQLERYSRPNAVPQHSYSRALSAPVPALVLRVTTVHYQRPLIIPPDPEDAPPPKLNGDAFVPHLYRPQTTHHRMTVLWDLPSNDDDAEEDDGGETVLPRRDIPVAAYPLPTLSRFDACRGGDVSTCIARARLGAHHLTPSQPSSSPSISTIAIPLRSAPATPPSPSLLCTPSQRDGAPPTFGGPQAHPFHNEGMS